MKVIALIALIAAAGARAEDCFDVGPDRGELGFRIDQAGSAFSGTFSRFGGRICTDGDVIAKVSGWMEPASINGGLPEIEDALRGEAFFAVNRYPRATFDSTDVEKTADGYVAHGTLVVKGVSKPVDVPFSVSGDAGARQVRGTFELHRLDFDIGTGEWADTRWVGDVATVEFSARIQ